ncbi:zf-HC2 domain-containing protein [Caldalkalibacillus salinus]|uniref:zf-HC2 domain-containing protein n=1 Tax=Caldalkalibacillus salinus TaxID=2803787 RepID=UPI0019241961
MNKISCQVIQDLMPSYLDDLTSEESNTLIEKHIKECPVCREMLQHGTEAIHTPNKEEQVEVSPQGEHHIIKRLKRKVVLVLSTVVVTCLLLGMIMGFYGPVIFQEGNPVPVVKGIVELHATDAAYAQISDGPRRYISIYKPSENHYDVIKSYLAQDGWRYKEQMGSGLVFEKDGETKVVETRLFTKHYYIWTLPEQHTKEYTRE